MSDRTDLRPTKRARMLRSIMRRYRHMLVHLAIGKLTRAARTETAKATRPKCGAWARSRGRPCEAPCFRREDGTVSRRCRMHGGASTGPKTPEGRARALANLRGRKR